MGAGLAVGGLFVHCHNARIISACAVHKLRVIKQGPRLPPALRLTTEAVRVDMPEAGTPGGPTVNRWGGYAKRGSNPRDALAIFKNSKPP
jgi:hypothetical protein